MSVNDYLEEALCLARKAAEMDEVPVGAVVVCDGKIVGRGHNRREKDQDPLAHAEILAIEEAAKNTGSWRLTGCQLIVTLEPCLMCLAACQQARLERVIYAAKDPKGGALSLQYSFHEDQRLNHRFIVEYREYPECSRILSEFFQGKRQDKPKKKC